MKKAWLILHEDTQKSIQQQEAELTAHCEEKVIQIVGRSTYGKSIFTAMEELASIAKTAAQHKCDYVAAADVNCVTDDYGVLVRVFLPFIKEGLTLYTADQGEILTDFFQKWPLIPYRFRNPDDFSIDGMLKEGEVPDYPQRRILDCCTFQIRRQGKIEEISFTDLCKGEQALILDELSPECLRLLCEELAWTLRYIGDEFSIFRNGQGGIFAMVSQDRIKIRERYHE